VFSYRRGWGDRALQKCNLSTQCARGLQVKHPPVRLAGPGFAVLWDALQARINAKNLSLLVGGAAMVFFFLGGNWRCGVAQAITAAGDLNDLGLLEEAI